MTRRVVLLAVGACAALACGAGSDRPDEGPEAGAFVVDRADLVAPDSRARMEDLLRALLEDADVELVAASVPSLDGESPERYSRSLFERWEIGRRTRGGRGVLLVIAERERKVRLEVGYALEGLFTDAFVGYVEREQMAPYFAGGRVGEGIEATVELVAGRAFERIRGGAWDPSARGPGSVDGFRGGGAGAQTAVTFGDSAAGPDEAAVEPAERGYFSAQPTPALAWDRFLETNSRRIKDPGLGIYDESAREIMRTRPVTNAGQDHIARLYASATPTIRTNGDRAVVVFLDDPDHLLAPWFFRRTPEGWRLNGAAVRDLIAYNHKNQWHFRRMDNPWMFAFRDFRFDAHGFAFHRPR